MSLQGRGLCKANFAATVKTIMPHVLAPANPYVVFISSVYRLHIGCEHQHPTSDLTMPIFCGIFNITHLQHNPDGPETKVRSQVASASRTRFVEPPIPPGHRRTVSDSRVFRSSRFGTSQIRDAAPSSNRGTAGQPIGECLRVLAPFLLPSAGGLPAGRTPGAHAAEARTEAGTQAHRRSARFPAPGASARSILACGGSEFARPGQVRHQRSSAQHRACLGAESKKNEGNQILTLSVASEGFVARYEQLRNSALSRSSPSASNFGLTLFLRQGMIAWMMHACSCAVPATLIQSAIPSHPVSPLRSDVRSQATLILAGIILNQSAEMTRCKAKLKK
jgi:hypothetical protein